MTLLFLLYSFKQGDVHEFFILFKSEKLKMKFTGALENVYDTNLSWALSQKLLFWMHCKFWFGELVSPMFGGRCLMVPGYMNLSCRLTNLAVHLKSNDILSLCSFLQSNRSSFLDTRYGLAC